MPGFRERCDKIIYRYQEDRIVYIKRRNPLRLSFVSQTIPNSLTITVSMIDAIFRQSIRNWSSSRDFERRISLRSSDPQPCVCRASDTLRTTEPNVHDHQHSIAPRSNSNCVSSLQGLHSHLLTN